MNFKIYTTEEFDKLFNKLDADIQGQIRKEISQLELNPYVGKPLGYRFFREKKVKNYRIYYLIYNEYLVVFIITLSRKKDQQNAINSIKKLIPLSENIKNILNQAAIRLDLSGRAYHKVIKIARTIADLAGEDKIAEPHILEALQYRPK